MSVNNNPNHSALLSKYLARTPQATTPSTQQNPIQLQASEASGVKVENKNNGIMKYVLGFGATVILGVIAFINVRKSSKLEQTLSEQYKIIKGLEQKVSASQEQKITEKVQEQLNGALGLISDLSQKLEAITNSFSASGAKNSNEQNQIISQIVELTKKVQALVGKNDLSGLSDLTKKITDISKQVQTLQQQSLGAAKVDKDKINNEIKALLKQIQNSLETKNNALLQSIEQKNQSVIEQMVIKNDEVIQRFEQKATDTLTQLTTKQEEQLNKLQEKINELLNFGKTKRSNKFFGLIRSTKNVELSDELQEISSKINEILEKQTTSTSSVVEKLVELANLITTLGIKEQNEATQKAVAKLNQEITQLFQEVRNAQNPKQQEEFLVRINAKIDELLSNISNQVDEAVSKIPSLEDFEREIGQAAKSTAQKTSQKKPQQVPLGANKSTQQNARVAQGKIEQSVLGQTKSEKADLSFTYKPPVVKKQTPYDIALKEVPKEAQKQGIYISDVFAKDGSRSEVTYKNGILTQRAIYNQDGTVKFLQDFDEVITKSDNGDEILTKTIATRKAKGAEPSKVVELKYKNGVLQKSEVTDSVSQKITSKTYSYKTKGSGPNAKYTTEILVENSIGQPSRLCITRMGKDQVIGTISKVGENDALEQQVKWKGRIGGELKIINAKQANSDFAKYIHRTQDGKVVQKQVPIETAFMKEIYKQPVIDEHALALLGQTDKITDSIGKAVESEKYFPHINTLCSEKAYQELYEKCYTSEELSKMLNEAKVGIEDLKAKILVEKNKSVKERLLSELEKLNLRLNDILGMQQMSRITTGECTLENIDYLIKNMQLDVRFDKIKQQLELNAFVDSLDERMAKCASLKDEIGKKADSVSKICVYDKLREELRQIIEQIKIYQQKAAEQKDFAISEEKFDFRMAKIRKALSNFETIEKDISEHLDKISRRNIRRIDLDNFNKYIEN